MKNYLNCFTSIILLLSLFGCEENNVCQPYNSVRNSFEKRQYCDYLGEFNIENSKSSTSLSELKHYEIIPDTLVIEGEWSFFSSANFTTNNVDFIKLNDTYYEKNEHHSNNYDIKDFEIKTNGNTNLIEWSINNRIFSTSFELETDVLEIISPKFLDTIPRNKDLEISWVPTEAPEDYISIYLSGNLPHNQTGKVGKYFIDTDDDGSYIIRGSELLEFNESNASVIISRTKVDEEFHNNQPYLIKIRYTDRYDVIINQ